MAAAVTGAGYRHIQVPEGEKVTIRKDGTPDTPNRPIIGFIEGDGIGPDIWKASKFLFDEVVKFCYGGTREVAWMEIFAGERANDICGSYLPGETLDAVREFNVAIKGPLTTPIGDGFRSLNVSLRQELDLFACVRPIRHFEGVPSPVCNPQLVDMVIFRENTEDVYAGFEFRAGSVEANKIIAFCRDNFGWDIRAESGIGIKPVSEMGSKRLIRSALRYAVKHGRKSVTLVHKGNIMKYTEGAFMNWGYEVVRDEFSDVAVSWEDCGGKPGDKILVKDAIADITLQQVLTRPEDFDVVATLNLNGDYLSDALAAQVGGIGIAPGANINYETGVAMFEATHGTAPKYANQDKVNPSSLVLSGVMMFDHLGWTEAAETLTAALMRTYRNKTVTYDFARLMNDATLLKCSEFAQAARDNFRSVS
jgi:isocitrate dehydrogenase